MPNALIIILIPLLPLASFLLLGLFGKKVFRQYAAVVGTLFLLVATILSLYVAFGYFFEYGKLNGVYQKLNPFHFTWLAFSENLSIDMGFLLDPISVMVIVVVTFISLMVHVYSIAYMKGEERYATYFAFLSLFTFSMLGL